MIHYLWFIIGLLAFVSGLWQGYEAVYPYYWYRETPGRVVEAMVETTVGTDPETGSEKKSYHVKITREYFVDGVKFTGVSMRNTGLVYYWGPDPQLWAQKRASRFKVGDAVRVFYDPRDPNRSFVIIAFPWIKLIPILLTLLMGSVLMVFTFSQINQGRVRIPGARTKRESGEDDPAPTSV